jgi:hypothetical protein
MVSKWSLTGDCLEQFHARAREAPCGLIPFTVEADGGCQFIIVPTEAASS